MIPVSVVVATRNEEARIGRCLAALKEFDEVIIVDSCSDDNTPALAAAAGAQVVSFRWDGQYPKKRQWCLDHLDTRHGWIFFVDADEIVTPELVDEIAALDFTAAGYFVVGRYIWQGKRLRHGVRNNKLVLLHREKFYFPAVDDLDLPMGEMEGHYQPRLKDAYRHERIGTLRHALDHDAAPGWDARHDRYAVWEREMNRRNAWPRDPVLWRQALKKIFRALPTRGAAMFLYSYVWRLGFLDGRAGYNFARTRADYYRRIGSGD